MDKRLRDLFPDIHRDKTYHNAIVIDRKTLVS